MVFDSGFLLAQLAGEFFPAPSPGPPPLGRRLTVEDIHRLCTPVFYEQGSKAIRFVGVFGEYAQGKQKKDSEVEFLVGFCSHTPSAVIHKTLHTLKQALPVALGRPADVLDMSDGEIRGHLMLNALEEAKWVYGDKQWFLRNYIRATGWILDARGKISKATSVLLRLMRLLTPMDDVLQSVFLPKNTVLRSFLLSLIVEYCEHITFNKTHPYYDAFPLVSDWIVEKRDLVERLRDSSDFEKDKADWMHLCAVLHRCLPMCVKIMRDVYIPKVRVSGRNARDVYHRYYG